VKEARRERRMERERERKELEREKRKREEEEKRKVELKLRKKSNIIKLSKEAGISPSPPHGDEEEAKEAKEDQGERSSSVSIRLKSGAAVKYCGGVCIRVFVPLCSEVCGCIGINVAGFLRHWNEWKRKDNDRRGKKHVTSCIEHLLTPEVGTKRSSDSSTSENVNEESFGGSESSTIHTPRSKNAALSSSVFLSSSLTHTRSIEAASSATITPPPDSPFHSLIPSPQISQSPALDLLSGECIAGILLCGSDRESIPKDKLLLLEANNPIVGKSEAIPHVDKIDADDGAAGDLSVNEGITSGLGRNLSANLNPARQCILDSLESVKEEEAALSVALVTCFSLTVALDEWERELCGVLSVRDGGKGGRVDIDGCDNSSKPLQPSDVVLFHPEIYSYDLKHISDDKKKSKFPLLSKSIQSKFSTNNVRYSIPILSRVFSLLVKSSTSNSGFIRLSTTQLCCRLILELAHPVSSTSLYSSVYLDSNDGVALNVPAFLHPSHLHDLVLSLSRTRINLSISICEWLSQQPKGKIEDEMSKREQRDIDRAESCLLSTQEQDIQEQRAPVEGCDSIDLRETSEMKKRWMKVKEYVQDCQREGERIATMRAEGKEAEIEDSIDPLELWNKIKFIRAPVEGCDSIDLRETSEMKKRWMKVKEYVQDCQREGERIATMRAEGKEAEIEDSIDPLDLWNKIKFIVGTDSIPSLYRSLRFSLQFMIPVSLEKFLSSSFHLLPSEHVDSKTPLPNRLPHSIDERLELDVCRMACIVCVCMSIGLICGPAGWERGEERERCTAEEKKTEEETVDFLEEKEEEKEDVIKIDAERDDIVAGINELTIELGEVPLDKGKEEEEESESESLLAEDEERIPFDLESILSFFVNANRQQKCYGEAKSTGRVKKVTITDLLLY
ncbi:hypothetical protein ADUPG1_010276, partial [Aduncisulcus paluster]